MPFTNEPTAMKILHFGGEEKDIAVIAPPNGSENRGYIEVVKDCHCCQYCIEDYGI